MAEQKHTYQSPLLNKLMVVFPFLAWLPLVTRDTVKADLIAGITNAVVVLPQGMAVAIIAGMPPEYGLYTAMVTPIVAAMFGSSRHLISGPTTAIGIVMFSAISVYAQPGTDQYVALAITLTFLVGIYQLAFGLARLGVLVNFVSHTVVIGFTAGAAILIATKQIKNVLGIHVPKGETFLHTWVDVWDQLGDINYYVMAIAAITIVTAATFKMINKKLPALLFGLVAGSVVAWFFNNNGTVGIELVGTIPRHLPELTMPMFDIKTLRELAPGAFPVALLALIEAVSISRAIATKTHQRIDGNQEFIGQGLSNIVASFFSSYAGSGSFVRSSVNYESGAQTPLSAVFAAIALALIVLLIAPLSGYLPIASMGGVIFLVAYSLIDVKQIRHVIQSSTSETAILLTTFLSTLFLELEFAIYLGVLLSLIIFLARTSTPEIVALAPDVDKVKDKHILSEIETYRQSDTNELIDVDTKPVDECPELKIIRIDMSIYFGSLNFIQSKLYKISETEKRHHIVIDCESVNFIDLAGAEMLCEEADRLEAEGGGLYFTGMKPKVYQAFSKTHAIAHIGNNHFFDKKKDMFKTLHRLIRRQGKCDDCQLKVFVECRKAQET